jgi:hypothetical protein
MKTISNTNNILKLLTPLKKGGLECFYYWTSTTGIQLFRGELIKVSPQKKLLTIQLEGGLEGISNLNELKNLESKVYLPGGSHYFFSIIRSIDSFSKIEMAIPEVVFFKERREKKRLLNEGLLEVEFSLGGRVLRKHCHDLAKGGFSLIFSGGETLFPNKKGALNDFSILIDKQRIKMRAEVIDILKLESFQLDNAPYAKVKLSCRWSPLNKKEQLSFEELWDYINEIFPVSL